MNRRARRLFQKKTQPSSPQIFLQITSMADIFTILLVFLLKGYATDVLAITPSSETRLPEASHTTNSGAPALKVELSRKGLMVNQDFISGYPDFETPFRRKLSAERSSETPKDPRVILLADQEIPFSKLKIVMGILSEKGFSSIRFGAITP
jgi:biopolymer transport protein ExbD